MNKKQPLNRMLSAILISPRALILFLFGLGAIPWVFHSHWKASQIEWNHTEGTLVEVQLSERFRNKKKEFFLKLTYEYKVKDNRYEAYAEKILLSERDAGAKRQETKNKEDRVSIYYKTDSPTETTFRSEDTKADSQTLCVVIPSMMMIAGFGYWILKIRYDYYSRTKCASGPTTHK